jgi:hypothetical protein
VKKERNQKFKIWIITCLVCSFKLLPKEYGYLVKYRCIIVLLFMLLYFIIYFSFLYYYILGPYHINKTKQFYKNCHHCVCYFLLIDIQCLQSCSVYFISFVILICPTCVFGGRIKTRFILYFISLVKIPL